jgi:hypothetical protein
LSLIFGTRGEGGGWKLHNHRELIVYADKVLHRPTDLMLIEAEGDWLLQVGEAHDD